MMEFDINKLKDIKIDVSTTYNLARQIQAQNDNAIRAVESACKAKEEEELRRHNELVSALKEAGEKGATIVIGDNAKDIQIQQNSANATQSMLDADDLDYDKLQSVLYEIKEYFDFPQFEQTFGNNTDNIKNIVEETILAIEHEGDIGLIKKSINIIRDIAVNAAGGLISSGIIALLGNL